MTRDEIVQMSRDEAGGMYIVIPSVVKLDAELPLSAQMLYGIITWKCSKNAYTWATNRELGEALGVSAKRASALLSLLEQRGHIETEIKYKDGTNEILCRYIYPIMKSAKGSLQPDPIPKNKDTPPHECGYLPSETGGPLPENEEVICNIKNNKKNNTPYSPPNGGRERKRFVPPSVDEVRAYCLERKNGIDPEAFVAFYASKGWQVGRTPMKDWKAAVHTWERRRAGPGKEQDDHDDWYR